MNNLPTRLEVEEELQLHVELLQHEYMQRGMSPEEARAATLKRFGNFDRVKNECVAICRRSHPLQRAFKILLLLLALAGLIIRITSTDYFVARIGPILITIAIAGRLLLYVRGLSPSRSKPTSFSLFS